ncbi:MFS transporter [Auraticoccus monumenti]|uniref:Multidrug efflux pump Tap n=1 Tax=Auraticoccus monumenti TaxID=675864 RepID=A0A1G7A741_9ACTN|nr:MFS transporter [Auraticoccus monumenti]SDE09865.1 Major Facilitator Superfamily protein [Auraticoccus monumenti]
MHRIRFFYLAGFSVSLLGNSITAIALPLVVLLTTGSPLGAGIVAIAAAVPAAVAGLLMGALVDRVNRRTAAVLSDVISAVALLILPVVHLTVGLELGWFVAVAVLSSFGDVPGITAREAMLPAVADAAGLDPAKLIGIRESLSGASFLLGPAAAGILVATLEPVTVLWITSGLAALAALLTLALPARATVLVGGGVPAPAQRSMFRGLVIIFRSPLLRGLVLLGLALAIVLAATQGMVIPVHFAFQGDPQLVGFVLSALAAGLLVGRGGFAVLGHRVPHRVWLVVGLVLVAVGFSVIAVLGPAWSVLTGAAVVGLGAGCMNAVVGLALVDVVADSQRGTVLGAQNALLTLVPAVGIGAAAVLIEAGGLQLTTIALAALWVVSVVAALLTPPLRRLGSTAA